MAVMKPFHVKEKHEQYDFGNLSCEKFFVISSLLHLFSGLHEIKYQIFSAVSDFMFKRCVKLSAFLHLFIQQTLSSKTTCE